MASVDARRSRRDQLSQRGQDAALAEAIERIWEEARAVGLRPFPTHFEIVPATILYEVGSYLMPGRFSHWTHGKMYQMQKTMYDWAELRERETFDVHVRTFDRGGLASYQPPRRHGQS